MPGPVNISDEVRIQSQKDNHMDVIKDYMRTNCDKDGNMRESENLTRSEIEGRRQVREGIASKGWMLYQTDKSGKLCLDSVSNYEKCMAEHVLKDPIVTPEMVKQGENELNNHARQWVKITDAGSDKGHQWRINRALVNN